MECDGESEAGSLAKAEAKESRISIKGATKMKKVFIAAAAAMASAIALAVESSNTVGYKTYEFCEDDVNDVYIYAQNVGLSLTAMTNNGAILVEDKLLGRTIEDGDQVTIFNVDYDMNDIYQFMEGEGWQKTVFTFDGITHDMMQNFTIPAGATFNFTPADPSGSITMSGEVAPKGTQTQTFQMVEDDVNDIWEYTFPVVNPYPIATTLADIATFASVDGDQFRVYNAEYDMYDIYQFMEGEGWQKTVFTFDGITHDMILEADWATTTVLDVGQGGVFTPADDTLRTWSVTYND